MNAMLKRIILPCVIFTLATYSFYWLTRNQSAKPVPQAVTKKVSASENFTFPASIEAVQKHIVIRDAKITAQIKDAPLRWLLSEIKSQSEISIEVSGVSDASLISADLIDAPLLEGLVKLLRDFDVFLFFGATTASTPTVKTVWIYPKHKGESLAPRNLSAARLDPREIPIKSTEVDYATQAGLKTTDPEVAAVELTQALQSAEVKVRYSALATSLENKIELSIYKLQQMTSSDPDHKVRELALTALAQHPSADMSLIRTAAEMALKDNDAEVQALAKGTLEYLDLAEKRNDDISQSAQEQ